MATTNTPSTTTTTPCYVFRLISFDEEGNKVQKRKYGFTAKNTDAEQLDENVFNGIIARAEQTFNLRPSSYSLYLVLGPGPYATELGETDLHLDDYPALSSHSWTALHTYNQFHHKRNQIAGLTADKKGRKVVNLCLIKTTLHNVAKARKLKMAMEKGKGKESVKEEDKISDTSSPSASASPTASAVDPASITAAPPTPPKEAIEEEEAVEEEDPPVVEEAPIKQENSTSTNKRSSSPVVQDVADLVSRFANFIAPLPTAPISTGAAPSGHHPGMEFIKRAAEFIAPPPVPAPLSASSIPFFNSNSSPGNVEEIAKEFGIAEPCAYVSGWTKHASSYFPHVIDESNTSNNTPGLNHYKPYIPPSRRESFPNPTKALSPADKAMKEALASAQRAHLRAEKFKKEALLKAQKAKFDADTIAKLDPLASYPFAGNVTSPPSVPPTSKRVWEIPTADEVAQSFDLYHGGSSSTTASASFNIETAQKYASLKSSFDKFVNDFNANLADAFGGPVPEMVPTLPSKTAANSDKEGMTEKKEDATIYEAKGEKETPTVQATKKGNTGLAAHNATCDVCDQWIVGVRYKCFTCPDWDCCAKCYAQVDRLHPSHALAALHEPNDLIRRRDGHSAFSNSSSEVNPTARHFAIHCDGCNKPISGIRYKCAHPSCPDFDLCATCEADPISYTQNRKIGNHSYRDHLLVKIRKPIAVAGTIGPFGRFSTGANVHANRVQLDRAIDSIRKAFPIPTTGSNNSSSFSGTSAVPAAFPKVQDVTAMTASTTSKTAAKDDKTWVIDVPLPFAIQGGQKDIHLTFDLGKNDKGETVILNHTNGESFDNVVMETILKEVKALSLNDKKEDASKKDTTVSNAEEEEEKAEPTAQQSQMKDARLEYDARWINDVTYNDGESVFPGTVFNKIWNVENTGSKNWPEGTRLICVSGFGKDLGPSSASNRKEVSYEVKSATSGDKVNIIAEDIIAPEIAGKFMSYYRFVAPDGTRFGDRLWIDIIVDEGNAAITNSSTSASSGSVMKKSDASLDSSRIVTPTLKVRGSSINVTSASTSNSVIQESTDTATVYSEAITSPRSTGSDLPDIDTMSTLDGEDEEDCDFVLLSDDDEYDQV